MSDVSVEELESLLAKKKGDPVRLQSIIDSMKIGKKLSDSDQMFIEHLHSMKDSSTYVPTPTPESAIKDIVITTTPNIQGSKIEEYLGIVSGEAVMGANILRDTLAGITDVIGGRSGQYENRFRRAKEIALSEMAVQAKTKEANAIVGVAIDYEMVRESMMMVSVHGTAVKIVQE